MKLLSPNPAKGYILIQYYAPLCMETMIKIMNHEMRPVQCLVTHFMEGTNHAIVNVETLEHFEAGDEITPEMLSARGTIRPRHDGVKILGMGDLTKALVVHAHKFSQTAIAKIEAAGGKVQVIGRD